MWCQLLCQRNEMNTSKNTIKINKTITRTFDKEVNKQSEIKKN